MNVSSRAPESCLNHAERATHARCHKCNKAFCDGCLAFSVNGTAWCELCGNALLEELRPRWLLASATFGVPLLLISSFYVWYLRSTGLLLLRSTLILAFVILGGAGRLAWTVLVPTTGDRPRIERRALR